MLNGVTTYYVGNHFEWTASTSTMIKYYYAGSQRVAMRQGSNAPLFLSGEHLGSTSLTTNNDGTLNSSQRYYPWGSTRAGSSPTAYQFTGQRNDAAIGLYFYNARYYDSALGRFIQADTIVPNPTNPQSLNRYAYVLNNPLRYTDPSGHFEEDEIEVYLRNKYGDKWETYWRVWKEDHIFWAMLRAADYGDWLSAPSTILHSGRFVASAMRSTFDFVGYNELYEFQGNGPYHLEDAHGYSKDDITKVHTTGGLVHALYDNPTPVCVDSLICAAWYQPVYNYTSEGPVWTGTYRLARYTYQGKTNINVLAGGDDPLAFGELGIGGVLVKLGVSWAGVPAMILGLTTAINNAVTVDLVFETGYYEPTLTGSKKIE